jgi:hypothetical protein
MQSSGQARLRTYLSLASSPSSLAPPCLRCSGSMGAALRNAWAGLVQRSERERPPGLPNSPALLLRRLLLAAGGLLLALASCTEVCGPSSIGRGHSQWSAAGPSAGRCWLERPRPRPRPPAGWCGGLSLARYGMVLPFWVAPCWALLAGYCWSPGVAAGSASPRALSWSASDEYTLLWGPEPGYSYIRKFIFRALGRGELGLPGGALAGARDPGGEGEPAWGGPELSAVVPALFEFLLPCQPAVQ